MSAPQFDILFRGVRKGFDPSQVKTQFAALFKLDSAKVERIFKATNVTLKNSANQRLADIFVARLFAIGVVADKHLIEPLVSKAIPLQDAGATSSEASSMHQPVDFLYGEHTRRIPFIFTGNGVDYCKVWLVNLLVCLLSAGVLYPWAQVRSLRYFYHHTYLDNSEFLYVSNPQKILLVQFALLLYVAGLCFAFFHASIYGFMGVVGLIGVMPLYWHKCSAFQQQHSFYCEVSFQQTSTLRDAYIVLLVWPLLAVLSGGIAAPYAAFKIQQYRTKTTSIGGYSFSFLTTAKKYFSLLPLLLTAETLTFACWYYREHLPLGFSLLMIVGIWLLVFIQWQVALVNLQWNSTTTKLGYFVATWDLPSYKKLVVNNWLLCLVTVGFYWPWAKIRVAEYKSTHLAFFANQRFYKWKKQLR